MLNVQEYQKSDHKNSKLGADLMKQTQDTNGPDWWLGE